MEAECLRFELGYRAEVAIILIKVNFLIISYNLIENLAHSSGVTLQVEAKLWSYQFLKYDIWGFAPDALDSLTPPTLSCGNGALRWRPISPKSPNIVLADITPKKSQSCASPRLDNVMTLLLLLIMLFLLLPILLQKVIKVFRLALYMLDDVIILLLILILPLGLLPILLQKSRNFFYFAPKNQKSFQTGCNVGSMTYSSCKIKKGEQCYCFVPSCSNWHMKFFHHLFLLCVETL